MNLILPSIIQSTKPFHCGNIAVGRKEYEVRKTKPNISTPFKSYIYCTKGKLALLRDDEDAEEQFLYEHWKFANFHQSFGRKILNGKVIGEYICDEIQEWLFDNETNSYDISDDNLALTCLTQEQLWEYGKGKTLYGYHITNLKIYDEPKELSEFYHDCGDDSNCENCPFYYVESNESIGTHEECCSKVDGCKPLSRPPQSWCYVEEM